MDSWDVNRSSEDLITNIRKIILVTPELNWSIENGEFVESH